MWHWRCCSPRPLPCTHHLHPERYNTLLQAANAKLNAIESVELARPVIAQNKLPLLEGWIKQNKLTMTSELGDLIRAANPQLALNVYQQSGSPDKVIQGLIEAGQLDKIGPYCQA